MKNFDDLEDALVNNVAFALKGDLNKERADAFTKALELVKELRKNLEGKANDGTGKKVAATAHTKEQPDPPARAQKRKRV